MLNYVQGALQAYETGAVRDMMGGLLSSARRAAKEAGYTDEQIQQVEQRLYEVESKVGQIFEGLGESESVFQDDVETINQKWSEQIEKHQKGEFAPHGVFAAGPTPRVLAMLGLQSLPLQMEQKRIVKIAQKHNLPLELLKGLPGKIREPLMVLESATMANSMVVVTDLVHEGKPVVVAIHSGVVAQRAVVNDIATVFPKDNFAGWLERQVNEGKLRYLDKKRSPAWFRELTGLQLPGVMNLQGKSKILTDKDVVKPLYQDSLPTNTESPEFKAWFGDSQVVDDNGEPLVVYHGTDADFEAFARSQNGAFFFTDRDLARRYGDNIKACYIRLSNPFFSPEHLGGRMSGTSQFPSLLKD